jgi:hypothetical protein
MNTNSDQAKRRLLAAVLAFLALIALVAAIARTRSATPTTALAKPTFAVVKLPGGGQRTVVIQSSHATTQTSPGGGQTQLVSTVGPNGQPVFISQPVGGGDR